MCKQLLLVTLLAANYGHAQTTITVDATARRMTGGVTTLDRAQYFNHWGQGTPGQNTNLGNLEHEVHSPLGLHSFSGRETNDFTVGMQQQYGVFLPEDPGNPGFFDHAALVGKLQNNTDSWGYKYRVLQSSTFDSIRDSLNPIYVTGGREGGFYPDFIDGGTDHVTNYAGYADFINVYLEEVVYGTGVGQGYLPMDKERFYIEIMNEPNWKAANATEWQEVIDMHREVTQYVKEQHPQAKLGGPSCCDGFNENALNEWDRARALMDDMVNWQTAGGQSVELDFWTIHPYERYNVLSDGSWEQQVFTSPGRVAASMDLFESYSHMKFGDPKAFAVTEYGSFNKTDIINGPGTADDDYGNYTRAEQQWDLVRDTREKLMVFMSRPDRIINATPFLGPKHFENQTPTSPAGDNVFWERDQNGDWHETIVASMYRLHNDIKGEYLQIDSDNPDVQTHAFRDGDKLYVMLNNLENSNTSVNLQALAGSATVTSASLDRIYWNGATGVYEENLDVSSSWQNLQLLPDEGSVLTLNLSDQVLYDHASDTSTYYGDDVTTPLNIAGGQSKTINVLADKEDALSAKVRVSYNREGVAGALPGESFDIVVNGNTLNVPAGVYEFDDNDPHYVAREINVPLAMLNDGNNTVVADFSGDGGYLISTVLEITRSIGDFNTSSNLDTGDIDQLYQQFGPASAGDKHDLNNDGQVDIGDVDEWLALRNTVLGDADIDGDVDTRDAVLAIANFGLESSWGRGNFNGDTTVTFVDLAVITNGFTGANSSGETGPADVGTSVANPDLVYDPITGNVSIDADGLSVIAFHLGSQGQFIATPDFSELDASLGVTVSTIIDSTASDIGWVSEQVSSGTGFDSTTPANLGAILPAGLNLASLQALLDGASWAGFGTGGTFDLVVSLVPGDFDGDGYVGLSDLNILGGNFPTLDGSATAATGDANGDGNVDLSDLNILGGNWNPAPAVTIPEPSASTLTVWLSVLLVCHRYGSRTVWPSC